MKLKTMKSTFLLFITNTIWISFFYILFDQDKIYLPYSLISGILASIMGGMLFDKVNDSEKPSAAFFFTYIVCLYFELSTVKFPYQNYSAFIVNPHTRLLGDFIVFVAVLITTRLCKMSIKCDEREYVFLDEKKIGPYCWVISIGFFVYFVNYIITHPISTYLIGEQDVSTISQVRTLIRQVFQGVGIYLCVQNWNKKFISKIPGLLIILSILIYTLHQGSRYQIVVAILAFIYLLICIGKLDKQWFGKIYCLGPIAVIALTYFTFIISGRREVTHIASDIQYRFCLTDFPLTLLNNTSYFRLDFREIPDALRMCVPAFFGVNKGIDSYSMILMEAGLNPNVDYTDTIFSTGAVMFGIIGMVFILPILGMLFNMIQKCFLVNILNKKEGFLFFVFFVQTIAYIEYEIISVLPLYRNCLIMILISMLFFYVITRIRIL